MKAHLGLLSCTPALLFLGLSAGCLLQTDPAELGVYHGSDASSSGDAAPAEDAGSPTEAGPEPSSDAGSSAPCVPPDEPVTPEPSSCFDILARSSDSAQAPYNVSTEGDGFVTFTVRNPLSNARTILSIEPIISNAIVLHDMHLYQHAGSLPEGVAHGKARGLGYLHDWWPGLRQEAPDGGLAIQPNAFFTLEVRYVTTGATGGPFTDRSGLRVCTTQELPASAWAYTRLGSETFTGASAQGTCRPNHDVPFHILGVRASMNSHGKSAKLAIHRSTGEDFTLYDQPYSFDDEKLDYLSIAAPLLEPGDSLITTCEYTESVQSGPGANDEFCDVHVLHLFTDVLSSGAVGTCLQ